MATEQTERNKALVRRYYEEMANGRNLEVADDIFSPEYRHFAGSRPGPQDVKEFVAAIDRLWGEDARVNIDTLVAEGDHVVAIVMFQLTHLAPYVEIPATGKRVSFTEIVLWRIENEKIAERKLFVDRFSFLQQVGARILPPS